MLSITRMSSQLYMPHYPAIRSKAPRKAPAQRRRAAILHGCRSVNQRVDYQSRKSALTNNSVHRAGWHAYGRLQREGVAGDSTSTGA